MRRLRSALGRIRHAIRRRYLVHYDILILRKVVETPPARHPGYTLVEHPRFDPAVDRIDDSFGRDFDPGRSRRRFEAGLRFFELQQEGRAVATTWVVPQGERFIDELGIGLRAGDGILWARDIFVDAAARGRGLFAVLLDEVLTVFPGSLGLWSAVDRDNRASLGAHQRYGYAVVARFQIVHLFGQVMVRLRWPGGLPLGSVYKADSRVIRTGTDYRRFVRAHLA